MAIYSIYKFKSVGATQNNEPTILTTDYRACFEPEAQFDDAKIDALAPGESSIVVLRMKGNTVSEGYRVTRVPDYKANALMYDAMAKEYVKVSNGICVLDHSSTAGFSAAHGGAECVFVPHEAIALRPVFAEDGTVKLAWTYRRVNASDLVPISNTGWFAEMFDKALDGPMTVRVLNRSRTSTTPFIGRI